MKVFKSHDEKMTALLFSSDIEKVKMGLDAGADIEARRKEGLTPLLRASLYSEGDIVSLLLEHGADIEAVAENFNKGRALMFAATRESSAVLRLLIERKADVSALNAQGSSALFFAAGHDRLENIKLLLEAGADSLVKNQKGLDSAEHAMSNKHVDTSRFLREKINERLMQLRPAEGAWRQTGESEISLVSDKSAIGYRFTELFNFAAGTYTKIARNTVANAESQFVCDLREASAALVAEAKRQLTALGGKTALPEDNKPVLSAPPMGGIAAGGRKA